MAKEKEKFLFQIFQEKYKDIPAGKVDFFVLAMSPILACAEAGTGWINRTYKFI